MYWDHFQSSQGLDHFLNILGPSPELPGHPILNCIRNCHFDDVWCRIKTLKNSRWHAACQCKQCRRCVCIYKFPAVRVILTLSLLSHAPQEYTHRNNCGHVCPEDICQQIQVTSARAPHPPPQTIRLIHNPPVCDRGSHHTHTHTHTHTS